MTVHGLDINGSGADAQPSPQRRRDGEAEAGSRSGRGGSDDDGSEAEEITAIDQAQPATGPVGDDGRVNVLA
jgi:hypothetical protein